MNDTTPAQWQAAFGMHSIVELDFVISQAAGWPIGMMRDSPPEFKRRVLAAGISYQLTLSSMDYTLKRYVPRDLYENDADSLGDSGRPESKGYLFGIIGRNLRHGGKAATSGN